MSGVSDFSTEQLDRLEQLVADLRYEREQLDDTVNRARKAAEEIKSGARMAGEAAGTISAEVSRLRRI